MGYQLGVDLGTTFTAVAVHRGRGVEMVALGSRATAIPSVIWIGPQGDLLIGEPAERKLAVDPTRTAREFKRRLGDTTPLLLGGTPYSADVLLSRLLAYVVHRVSEIEGGAPEAIAVTHPANWGGFKKELLEQAIRAADLESAVLLTEPEAAALYYASQERVEDGAVIAAYDLGGGTFDAAVLRKESGRFSVAGRPEGIERLGGIDFDDAVFAHVTQALGDALDAVDPDDPATRTALTRLREECVEAKEALSFDTDVSIPVLLPTLSTDVRLTRGEFESMIRPRIDDSVGALRRALTSADVRPEDVSRVLLVGGSSRIPVVAQTVSAALGRPVAVDAHPKHAIALGAAIEAARVAGVVVPEAEATPAPAPAPEVVSVPIAPATAEADPPPLSEPVVERSAGDEQPPEQDQPAEQEVAAAEAVAPAPAPRLEAKAPTAPVTKQSRWVSVLPAAVGLLLVAGGGWFVADRFLFGDGGGNRPVAIGRHTPTSSPTGSSPTGSSPTRRASPRVEPKPLTESGALLTLPPTGGVGGLVGTERCANTSGFVARAESPQIDCRELGWTHNGDPLEAEVGLEGSAIVAIRDESSGEYQLKAMPTDPGPEHGWTSASLAMDDLTGDGQPELIVLYRYGDDQVSLDVVEYDAGTGAIDVKAHVSKLSARPGGAVWSEDKKIIIYRPGDRPGTAKEKDIIYNPTNGYESVVTVIRASAVPVGGA